MKKFKNRDRLYFTADLHLFHKKIIQFAKRPFASLDGMHDKIKENWNETVGEDAHVFILGDIHFGDAIKAKDFLNSLNGKKYLLKGNHDHDKRIKKIKDCFEWVENLIEIAVEDSNVIMDEQNRNIQYITLCHYAMRIWARSHYGAWQLYGHSHGNLEEPNDLLSIDVGVDNHNFMPVSYHEIKEIMKTKTFKPVDHHS